MTVTVEEMRRNLRSRQQERDERGRQRSAARLARMERARQVLVDRGAKRVILFGSLAAERGGPESDVDLAVEGLPVAQHIDALASLMELFGGRVDLVRMEEAGESLRGRIEAEGRELAP